MPKLYAFQEEAVTKFLNAEEQGYPSTLDGDDMGLGKTIVAIELDRRRRERMAESDSEEIQWRAKNGKILVVTRKSLLGNWAKEFSIWNPSLKVLTIDPTNALTRQAFLDDLFASSQKLGTSATIRAHKYQVFIVHWEALRLLPDLRKIKWLRIVADEVQAIKNPKAQVTQYFKRLKGTYKIDMSGTWTDDKPQDAWSILNHLYPNEWPAYWGFWRRHVWAINHDISGCCQAISRDGEPCFKKHKNSFREVLGTRNVKVIHRQMEPWYVRRMKQEVLTDLPDKYGTTIEVELGSKQRKAYNAMRDQMLAWVGENEDQPIAAPLVVAKLVRLQQFAVAYAELVPTQKMIRCKGDEGLVVCPLCKTQGYHTEIVNLVKLTDPSAKLDTCMDIVSNTTKPLVFFSQSKQAMYLLGKRLEKAKESYALLTGDTKAPDRTRLVQEFQDGKLRILCCTIQAGGVGLTLTASDTAVFVDRTWKPSLNIQAEDRLWRIGQKNAVQIIDLVARNTVDMGRLQRLELKWQYIKELLGDRE